MPRALFPKQIMTFRLSETVPHERPPLHVEQKTLLPVIALAAATFAVGGEAKGPARSWLGTRPQQPYLPTCDTIALGTWPSPSVLSELQLTSNVVSQHDAH